MQSAENKSTAKKDALGKSTPGKQPFFQAKLTVNQPNDVYEQEADAMADHVMRMAAPSTNGNAFFKMVTGHVQRKCQHCEEEEKLHRKESSGAEVQGGSELDSYVSTLDSSGQRLSETSRAFFEPRFGQDFSNVRIHNDSVAAKSAQSINASAYTTGNNIVFNQGQYSPDSENGKKLMAHELTHVVQQSQKAGVVQLKREKEIDGEISIIWAENDAKLFKDIVHAIGLKYHVPESKLFQPIESMSMSIYSQLARKNLKKGSNIKLHVNFFFNGNETIDSVKLSVLGNEVENLKTEELLCPFLPAPSSAESRQDRNKEAYFYARSFSRQLEIADKSGAGGISFNVSYDGNEFSPGFNTLEPTKQINSSQAPYSCYKVEREHIKPFFDRILITLQSFKPGYLYKWDIDFKRDEQGIMKFVKSAAHTDQVAQASSPRSEKDELRELGIPDRKEIYAGIFREADKQIREIGKAALVFTLEQLVLWYAGGIILKGLGMLGGAAGRALFPRVVALLRLNSGVGTAALSRGIAALSEAEQAEFATFMHKIEGGSNLGKGELTRLEQLFGKIETELGGNAVQAVRQLIRPLNGSINVGGGLEAGAELSSNLNPIVPNTGGPTSGIPNHIRAGFEEIASVFEADSATVIKSSRLPYGTVNWVDSAKGAYKVMASGGRLQLNVWTTSVQETQLVIQAFEKAGFKEVKLLLPNLDAGPGVVVTGIK